MLNPNDAKLIKLALRKVRFIIESINNGFSSFFKNGEIDNELLYAVSKALEYIGEQLNPEAKFHTPLSKGILNSYTNIAWKRVTQIRNRLEHNYSREIKPMDIMSILDDIVTLDKQLKGILVSNGEQTDKFFDHTDHNKNARYKSHVNQLLPPDEFYAVALFETVKGEDRSTDEQRFIIIERNFHLMKIFLSNTNVPLLMKDENRLMREKKTSALERAIEIIGQATKEVEEKTAQKITAMLKATNQVQIMSLWFSLRIKRDITAHYEKPPVLAELIKNAGELTVLHTVIVAFLAKEYNFNNSNLFKMVTSIADKHKKNIETFKAELEGEFKKLEDILKDVGQPEADIASKKREYQEQMQKMLVVRKNYVKCSDEIKVELKMYEESHKLIVALCPAGGFESQLLLLDKAIHELDELIKNMQMRMDAFEKAYQEALQKKQEPKKIEEYSDLILFAKRKQGAEEEKKEKEKEVFPPEAEREKKRKADEESTKHIPTLPKCGI